MSLALEDSLGSLSMPVAEEGHSLPLEAKGILHQSQCGTLSTPAPLKTCRRCSPALVFSHTLLLKLLLLCCEAKGYTLASTQYTVSGGRFMMVNSGLLCTTFLYKNNKIRDETQSLHKIWQGICTFCISFLSMTGLFQTPSRYVAKQYKCFKLPIITKSELNLSPKKAYDASLRQFHPNCHCRIPVGTVKSKGSSSRCPQ